MQRAGQRSIRVTLDTDRNTVNRHEKAAWSSILLTPSPPCHSPVIPIHSYCPSPHPRPSPLPDPHHLEGLSRGAPVLTRALNHPMFVQKRWTSSTSSGSSASVGPSMRKTDRPSDDLEARDTSPSTLSK